MAPMPARKNTKAASGQLVGYARVCTRQQDLALQLDALNQAGCERIFRDVGSGTLRKRPQLDACLEYLRSGDTLVVWRLDRLGRSLRHLVDVIAALEINGYVIERLHKHGRLIGYACARPTPSTRPPHAGASDGADHRDSQQHSKQGARSASVRP
jgi:Resolvase, N terminal domain